MVTSYCMFCNYRLSRAWQTIENAFRVFSAWWKIFKWPVRANPVTVDSIIKLQFAGLTTHPQQTMPITRLCWLRVPIGEIWPRDRKASIELVGETNALQPIGHMGSNAYYQNAKGTEKLFKEYLSSSMRALSWQLNHVRSCGKQLKEKSR